MKFRAYLLLIFALIANMWLFGPTIAADEKDVIRVGLSNSSFSTFEFSETTVVTSSVATVMDMANGAKIADIPANREIEAVMKNGRFFINIGGKEVMTAAQGPILVVSKGNLGIKNLNRKGNPAYYRGMIELTPVLPQNKNKFNIVNILDAQSYLKGVVPNEMPVRFGLNALKAQAVAARNYANRPQNPYKNYDICDSTACQVYFGVNSENPLSDRAVDETQGIFALYNKEPILALYSSTSGGITEDYECVYGTGNSANNSKPYLKSKKDYVKLLAESPAKVILSEIERNKKRFRDVKYVFVSDKNKPISASVINNNLNMALKENNIKGRDGKILHCTTHMFRATFATKLISNGKEPELVAKLLGQTTLHSLSHYAAISPKAVKEQLAPRIKKDDIIISNLWKTGDAKEEIPETAIPLCNGFCCKQIDTGICKKANTCLNCPMFIPSIQFISSYMIQLQEVEATIAIAKNCGYTKMLENCMETKKILEDIIKRLEEKRNE